MMMMWWCDDFNFHCVITLFIASFVNISCPFISVYSYMCTYVCIYTFHLHATHTHWFHVYMRTKYYAYTNTDQHSFICSFVRLYICLCAMHCFYMSIAVPVHIHLFCSMPVLIIVCTLYRCFHAYSHTHMKILLKYRHIKSVFTFVCVQYIASWMHLHVYILFVYFITCMCACLWFTCPCICLSLR